MPPRGLYKGDLDFEGALKIFLGGGRETNVLYGTFVNVYFRH